MPLLPEHHTHGGSVSAQGAGARLSGPTRVYLGLQSRDRALPLLCRGGGARWLFSAGGALLLPGGAPHTRAAAPEVEEILKITCRVKPLTSDSYSSCQSRIPEAHPPTSSTSHLKREFFSLILLIVYVSNQHRYDKDNRGAGMCERMRLLSSGGELSLLLQPLLVIMVWILLCDFFLFDCVGFFF